MRREWKIKQVSSFRFFIIQNFLFISDLYFHILKMKHKLWKKKKTKHANIMDSAFHQVNSINANVMIKV